MSANAKSGARISLHYFEDVLAVEFTSIAKGASEGLGPAQEPGGFQSPSRGPGGAGIGAGRRAGVGRGRRTKRRQGPLRPRGKGKRIIGAWAAGDPYVIAKAEPNS